MLVKVKKQGEDFLIPLPADFAELLHLSENTQVRLTVANDRLIIERTPQYTLEELIEGITPENRHDEIDFGPPQGNEVI